jgi:hypothetical protein
MHDIKFFDIVDRLKSDKIPCKNLFTLRDNIINKKDTIITIIVNNKKKTFLLILKLSQIDKYSICSSVS